MAYGKYRHSTIKSELGNTWYVEIWQKDFVGSSTEMDLAGEGFTVKWSPKGEVGKRVFIPSECQLNFIVKNQTDEDWLKDDVLKKGTRYHFIRIYKNTINEAGRWWYGWMDISFSNIENAPFPYEVSLTATDSYGYYGKKKDDKFNSYEDKLTSYRIKDLFLNFINDTDIYDEVKGFGRAIRTSVDWWHPADTYDSDDPCNLYAVSKGAVAKHDKIGDDGQVIVDSSERTLSYKESKVLDESLNLMGIVGFLSEGRYWFVQPNNYINNPSGVIKCYDYETSALPSVSTNQNTLLTIDQTNHTVLSGSSLFYEPAIKDVSIVNKSSLVDIIIPPGQDLTTEFYLGNITTGNATNYVLDFDALFSEVITWNPNSSPLGTNIFMLDTFFNGLWLSSISSTGTLTIKISDGATTKYLKENPSNYDNLEWTTTPSTITIKRGYQPTDYDNPINSLDGFVESDYDLDITDILDLSPSNQEFTHYTTHKFKADVPDPGITGDVFLEYDCTASYYHVIAVPSEAYYYLITATPTSQVTTVESSNISLVPDLDSSQNTNKSTTFTSTQNVIPSDEELELTSINIGANEVNHMFSIQRETNFGWDSVFGFQRGNPTPDDPKNINILRCEEVLDLRQEHLELLQADIYSPDISPNKLVKYDINGGSSYNYYLFNGGSFKAQSDVMSGEWYKIDDAFTPTVYDNVETEPDIKGRPSSSGERAGLKSSTITDFERESDSFGVLGANIPADTATTSLTLSANSKGLIKNGQKLLLSRPGGLNPVVITASAETSTKIKEITINSTTFGAAYPKGSTVKPLAYDFTNVLNDANTVRIPVRFKEAVIKGDPCYIDRYSVGTGVEVYKADASDELKLPSIGLADAAYSQNDDGYLIQIGSLADVDTSAFAEGDVLYVAVGGGLTATKPTGVNDIQNVGIVGRDHAINGEIQVTAIGRVNDVPNEIECEKVTTTGQIRGKMIQMFHQSFHDDLGTTLHYIPWSGTIEQSLNAYQEESAMVMPYPGRITSILVRTNLITGNGNLTLSVYTKEIGGLVGQAWVKEEEELLPVTSTDDNHAFNFVFDNAQHFEAGELVALGIKASADLSGSTYWYVTTVVEFTNDRDLSTVSQEFETNP